MKASEESGTVDKAAHKKILNKLLSLKSVGLVIVVGIIVISVSKFVDSVTDLVAALPEPEAITSDFDTKTQEQTLSVAKRIDDLFSNVLHVGISGRRDTGYRSYVDSYRIIDVDLQNLLLRQESRPLNAQSVNQYKLLVNEFSKLREHHKKEYSLIYATAREKRKLFHEMFKKILASEAIKPKT